MAPRLAEASVGGRMAFALSAYRRDTGRAALHCAMSSLR
jgi:hypothetical protein